MAMTPEAIAQISQLLESQSSRAEAARKQGNEELKADLTTSINAISNQVDEVIAKVDASEAKQAAAMQTMRAEMQAEFMAKIQELTAQMAALKDEVKTEVKSETQQDIKQAISIAGANAVAAAASGHVDPWQASANARFGPSGSQRTPSVKRFCPGESNGNPRDAKNLCKLQIKGFNRRVPPTVHKLVWEEIKDKIGDLVKDARLRIGKYNFMFEVEFGDARVAARALDLINSLDQTWEDPKTKDISKIRANTEKSPNERKANKVYGEIRKALELHIKDKGMEVDSIMIRTSGPRGPVYVVTSDGNDFEVCVMLTDPGTGAIRCKHNLDALAALQLEEAELKSIMDKALAAASRWE